MGIIKQAVYLVLALNMSNYSRITLLVVIANVILNPYLLATAKFLLKRFELCDLSANYSFRINLTIKTLGDKQYLDGNILITAPFDNRIRSNVTVHTLIANQYAYLLTINEGKSCDAMNKYTGELWYDLQRHAQMIPGLCPIAQGRYALHNYLLDFKKMTVLPNFPFGHLRFDDILKDQRNNVYSCFVLEANNYI